MQQTILVAFLELRGNAQQRVFPIKADAQPVGTIPTGEFGRTAQINATAGLRPLAPRVLGLGCRRRLASRTVDLSPCW